MIYVLIIIASLMLPIAMMLYNIQQQLVHQNHLVKAICTFAEAPHREWMKQAVREYQRDQS